MIMIEDIYKYKQSIICVTGQCCLWLVGSEERRPLGPKDCPSQTQQLFHPESETLTPPTED